MFLSVCVCTLARVTSWGCCDVFSLTSIRRAPQTYHQSSDRCITLCALWPPRKRGKQSLKKKKPCFSFMVHNFSWALGKASPELLRRHVAVSGEAGILSVTFLNKLSPYILHCFPASGWIFHPQLGPSPSAHFSRPLACLAPTVDDNLAFVFIFLSSADNGRGTKATVNLWEDRHGRRGRAGGASLQSSRPFSAGAAVQGSVFGAEQNTKRASIDFN